MTALTANAKINERYPGRTFSYYVASGFHVFAGGQVGVNASNQLQPAGTAGVVSVVGICQTEADNTTGTYTDPVNVSRGTWQVPVASATPAHINGTVYALDDASSTVTNSGSLVAAGILAAIEGSTTWVRF